MKKIYTGIVFLFVSSFALACPFCGCGVGNFYFGLMPDFNSKFVGVRYQYLPYHTRINGDESQFSKDYYHTIELWGGINLGKKWQLLGFVPYQVNYQHTDDGDKHLSGISDISVLANYKLFEKVSMHDKKSVSQQLWIGGGLKLPTGKYRIDPQNPETELGDVNAQAGSGSVDFLINSSYNLRFNKVGINTTAAYKINTTNNEQYRFGNRLNASSFVFYQVKAKKTILSPNAGLLYQHLEANKFESSKVDYSGGHLMMAACGLEMGFNKITLGANLQVPFDQNFAAGQTEAKPRTMVHASFTL